MMPTIRSMKAVHSRLINSKLFLLAGIDTAMIYTYSAKAIGMVCSPLTMWFILTFLSKEEMGFYYVIISLLGSSMLRDMGFSNILMLFASHEKSNLSWDSSNKLVGDPTSLRRLNGMMRLGMQWFGLGTVIFTIVMIPLGLYFLNKEPNAGNIAFATPWILSVLVISIAGLLAPITSIFEGCNRVKELRFLGIIQPLLAYPLQWSLLLTGCGLFAYGGFQLGGIIVSIAWFISRQRQFLKTILLEKEEQIHFEPKEMWPLLWRTLIGSAGGYMTISLFNPMAFAYLGSVEAGKLGASFALCAFISTLSIPFIGNQIPAIGGLWASKDYKQLNRLFMQCMTRLLFVSLFWAAMTWLLAYSLKIYLPHYGDRFVRLHQLPLMLLATVFMNLIMAQSFFVRANKQDPLVWASLTMGLLIAFSNWLLIRHFGLTGMLSGYLSITATMFVVYVSITRFNVMKWQRESAKITA